MEEISLLYALVEVPPQELSTPTRQRKTTQVNGIKSYKFNLGVNTKRVRGRGLVYHRPVPHPMLSQELFQQKAQE